MPCLGARASRPHRCCRRRCDREGRAPSLPPHRPSPREGSRGRNTTRLPQADHIPPLPACGTASPLPTRRTQSAGRHEDVVRTAAEQPSPVSMKHKYMHGYRHWHILVSHRRRRPFCGRLLHSAPGCSGLLQAVQDCSSILRAAQGCPSILQPFQGRSWLFKELKRRLLAACAERDGVQSDFLNSPLRNADHG
jgi:hypothetical protein